MKLIYKFILLLFIFNIYIYSQTFYNQLIKKNQTFSNTKINWEFILPFDFQYRTWKEGNYFSLEGKNSGIPIFFLRTATIQNLRQVEFSAFKKDFFNCTQTDVSQNQILEKIKQEINNPHLLNYQLCLKKEILEFRSFIFSENRIHIIILQYRDQAYQKIIEIINQIKFKNKSNN